MAPSSPYDGWTQRDWNAYFQGRRDEAGAPDPTELDRWRDMDRERAEASAEGQRRAAEAIARMEADLWSRRRRWWRR